jgi:hypothetical protein
MINKDAEAEHLGGGVVLFRDAIDIDFDYVYNFSKEAVQKERDAMYSLTIDPETNNEIYINKSGYFFHKDSVEKMPGRGSAIHRDQRPEVVELLSFLEKTKDEYLYKYFELFPLAFKCVWWKVKSHIVSYEKDVFLGSHSDVSADYIYGIRIPPDQLATRNIISVIIYFNDSVDSEEELNGKNFVEGHHYFNYLDIDYKPKKGDIMFFPSNFMAAHEVKSIKGGSRFTYLGWYSHGTPNPEVNENVVDPIKEPELAKYATNLYMPTLTEDYRAYLKSKGYLDTSYQYHITNSNY